MIDIDLEEELILKFGGRFRLTVLVQKRMVELIGRTSTRALVKVEGDTASLRHIVFEELRQDKIQLVPREEVLHSIEEERRLEERAKKVASTTEGAERTTEIFGSDIKEIKRQRIEDMAELLKLKMREIAGPQSKPGDPPRKGTPTEP